jgi:hypothetical protein
MDILKSVVELNNAGVALILQNKDQAAVPLLSESLHLIKTRIMNAPQKCPESTAPTQRFQQHVATHALSNLQDEQSFIWNEVFTISHLDNNEYLIFESEWQILYTSVIIFNIALMYHRQSKLRKPSCLAKAVKMYEMVTTLLGCDSHNHGTAVILKLAALNNISIIHYEQNNFDASRRGFGQLVWTVNSPVTSLPPVCQLNVNSMILNALLTPSCYRPTAPAA